MTDSELIADFDLHMRTAKMSPVTISYRLWMIRRLALHIQYGLLTATPRDLVKFQQSFVTLSRGSMDVYTRHVVAFYRWAVQYGHLAEDPTQLMVRIKVGKGSPHPIAEADLQLVFAHAKGNLRLAYVLAAFAGLRAGEICRLRHDDLTLDTEQPSARINGKGSRGRIVPLLPPVVDQLRNTSRARGPVMLTRGGGPYGPRNLSNSSSSFLRSIGVQSTLHSFRHYFATEVVKLTKDILLVRDLLGHASVATTQIYMASSIDGAQDRLAHFSGAATQLLSNK